MAGINFRRSNLLLILIFITAASLIFFVAGLTFRQLQRLSENTNWVYHSQKVSLDLESLYANLKDIETERRNLILDEYNTDAARIIHKRMYQNDSLLEHLNYDLKDNAEQLERLSKLSVLINKKYKIVESTFHNNQDYKNDRETVRNSLLASKNIMYNVKSVVDHLMNCENALLKKRRSDFLFSEKSTPIYLYIISVLSLAVLGAAFFQTFRDLRIVKRANVRLEIALETTRIAEKVGNYGVWTFDPERRLFDFSDNQKMLFSLTGNSQEGFSAISHRFVPNDYDTFLANMNKTLSGAETEPFITRYRNAEGFTKYFSHNLQITKMPGGKNLLLGITRDVTEDVKNKADLAEANKDLQFYFSSSRAAERIGNYGFWRWTKNDNLYWFSDNLYRIFGLITDPDLGLRELRKQIHRKDLHMVTKKLNQMYAGEVVDDFVIRIYRKNDGRLRYLSIIAKKMDWTNDLSYLIITKDVTDQITANQYLQEQNRILDTKNRELQAFNYVASHDLQEPLRKIETFISRLVERDYNNLSDSGKQYLDKTKASAGRMRKLIDDLLQFSRSTRSDSNFERSNLNVLFEEAKENLLTQIEQRHATITASRLPILEVIPFQIKQLFTNLISNSLKYSKKNVEPVLQITCERVNVSEETAELHNISGEFYRIIFRDNGIGFDNQYSEKIFQLFTRLHGKTDYEGTGIGLAICKKIVENHKGRIIAEGYEGEGAQFTVYLPVGAI